MGQLGRGVVRGFPSLNWDAKSGLVSQILASGEVCEEAAAGARELK